MLAFSTGNDQSKNLLFVDKREDIVFRFALFENLILFSATNHLTLFNEVWAR